MTQQERAIEAAATVAQYFRQARDNLDLDILDVLITELEQALKKLPAPKADGHGTS